MSTTIVRLDARGLEPPQPMMAILEALASLPAGAELHARTDRQPVYLYARLAERGFQGQTTQESNGGYLTRVWRHA